MTDNPLAVASPFNGGANWNTLGALPQTSLARRHQHASEQQRDHDQDSPGSDVETELSLLQLRQRNTARYFPVLDIRRWNRRCNARRGGNPCGGATAAPAGTRTPENTISSLSIGYTKQDGGAALNWRPSREWNFNAEYGYERYNYSQTDVNVTNENSGKTVRGLEADWLVHRACERRLWRSNVTRATTTRISCGRFSSRRCLLSRRRRSTAWFYAPAYQQFMFDHRKRSIANVAVDLVAFHGVTITPTFKFKDDNYGLNPQNQEGVSDSRLTSGGVDVGWVVTPYLSFGVSYYREYLRSDAVQLHEQCHDQRLWPPVRLAIRSRSRRPARTGLLANCLITTSDRERIDTFTAVANWTAIPDQLDLTVRYTVSKGLDQQRMLTQAPVTACGSAVQPLPGAIPRRHDVVQASGRNGRIQVRPHLARSNGTGSATSRRSCATPGRATPSTTGRMTCLRPSLRSSARTALCGWAANNPNYNVQMIAGSLITTW